MKLYLTFEADDMNQAQKIIAAVSALGIKPADMKYSLPTPAKNSGSETATMAAQQTVDNDEEQASHPTTRPNINPGFTACQKIGPEVKQGILDNLSMSVPVMAIRIKRTVEQTQAFLQLLWDRGVIKYDGESFYK